MLLISGPILGIIYALYLMSATVDSKAQYAPSVPKFRSFILANFGNFGFAARDQDPGYSSRNPFSIKATSLAANLSCGSKFGCGMLLLRKNTSRFSQHDCIRETGLEFGTGLQTQCALVSYK